MKALIISDKEFHNECYSELISQIETILKNKGFATEEIAIGKDDLTFCMGCFGCWVKKPGECVINDMMSTINKKSVNSDVVVYLSPVIFGQFSANIKNAVDRWIPNILPFFATRSDGATIHPWRYKTNPLQIFIGYGDDLSNDDRQLFVDIIKNHRKECEVITYYKGKNILEELGKINLKMAGEIK